MDEMPLPEEYSIKLSILGKTGAGKTTQAGVISSTLGIKHISSGDLVRKYLTDQSTIDELSKGHMAPDESAVRSLIERHINGLNSYILDGFPRMVDQLHTNISINLVIHLDASDEVVVDRLLKRGRPDDTINAIGERLRIYQSVAFPIIKTFDSMGIKVYSIDGDQSMGKVWADIMVIIDALRKSRAIC